MPLIRNKYGRLIEISGLPSAGSNTRSTIVEKDGKPLSPQLKPLNISKDKEEKSPNFEIIVIKGGQKIK